MKNTHIVVFASMVCLLAGCGTLRQNDTQYQVLGRGNARGTRVALTAADHEAVKQILTALAGQWGLQDRTTTSFMTNIMVSYSQDWNVTAYPLTLTAFEDHGRIIIDLSQQAPYVGETPHYEARRDQLLATLRQRFGAQLMVPPLIEYVRHVGGAPTR